MFTIWERRKNGYLLKKTVVIVLLFKIRELRNNWYTDEKKQRNEGGCEKEAVVQGRRFSMQWKRCFEPWTWKTYSERRQDV